MAQLANICLVPDEYRTPHFSDEDEYGDPFLKVSYDMEQLVEEPSLASLEHALLNKLAEITTVLNSSVLGSVFVGDTKFTYESHVELEPLCWAEVLSSAARAPNYWIGLPRLTLSHEPVVITVGDVLEISISEIINDLSQLLGQGVKSRLEELASFDDDWDDDGAKKLSRESLISFLEFARKFELEPDDLGIFLGFDGEVLINWHSKDRTLIDIAFRGGKVEVYTDEFEEVFCLSNVRLYRTLQAASF
ncbi:hypothetical protein RBU55_06485 [Pseudomonas chlororaphis subsp. aurantiaca]|uniref:hypothetical protein n=1 Tax=Pseudomonas chlororaphis TaxID=587753 RepID=UPI0027DBF1B5|nr:hypothetical protein [Pseudomonas chlororaphis]WMJ01196.1 hypothetical protein RBU55_06485 [Pseudomonas chlororaphis subsp. aurantiaca]